MSSRKTDAGTQVKTILSSFLEFKEKDMKIRKKAKDIFTQAKKRIDERKIKNVKERIKNV